MNQLKLLCVVFFTSIALPAFATTINFDDLPGDEVPLIPNGYKGLNWDNFYALDAASVVPVSGFLPATVSPKNVSFNGFLDPAFISDSASFDLISGYFTAGWNDNLQLQVIGSFMGTTLYDTTYTLSATDPTLINLNFLGIDSVEFKSFGGTPHPEYIDVGSGPNFALDNLVINQGANVPDAGSTVALLGIALSGLGFLKRKLA